MDVAMAKLDIEDGTGNPKHMELPDAGMTVKEGLLSSPLAPDRDYSPPPPGLATWLEPMFKTYERGSSLMQEFRAGCVLFMACGYILFLNPLTLSGGSANFNTGMPANDVALATSIATGVGTLFMGVFGNYPWAVSVQLAQFYLQGDPCNGVPCTCTVGGPVSSPVASCLNTTAACLGTKIPYEQALACTFLEGLTFLAICLFGLRSIILGFFPKPILVAGAAGIGAFIAYVGARDCGVITIAPYPLYTQLMTQWGFTPSGYGGGTASIGFNDCVMYFDGPPYGPVCPWLSVGGFILTAILLLWNVHGALIIGIFFVMFISWIKFPNKLTDPVNPGLVPSTVAFVPKFESTAGALNFNWGGNTQELIAAYFLFLYLDFVGSSITFVSMGQMMGLLDDKGNIPRSNMAFSADAVATIIGASLGTSALATYVESASAVREGGRTGLTSIVCSLFFFASVFLAPLFSQIPTIATGPILCLIGVIIFMSSVWEIKWHDLSETIPAFTAILGMPLTNNIAYGILGAMFMYVITKFVTYQLFPEWPLYQSRWPGRTWFMSRADTNNRGMFCRVPGFNTDIDPKIGPKHPHTTIWLDFNAPRIYQEVIKGNKSDHQF
ncbi:hypothetical protein CEUSTIGMA_g8368.t1 [Chlamydomonas eustigma]|uniref:Xanthine/uracil/vitamin C permease n=1 Tax=Chlamydomonas eustigma TaxID=1157962 RepID=A0A250XCX0_9CHLO|nr:hypothetical protein CEUSTIGMA_g8368.t1 [Chlamydomonas eustigma]|eukprot:GAX80933.1 hypothetical protein CEUSTIGMA_g8368.t1 [Chlamydomonas eustigma]